MLTNSLITFLAISADSTHFFSTLNTGVPNFVSHWKNKIHFDAQKSILITFGGWTCSTFGMKTIVEMGGTTIL